MITKPYKLLEPYYKEDFNIFFGREGEIEELNYKIQKSNLLLLYGASGTGKTSIVNCGLANKLPDTDWLPLYIRRNHNIMESIRSEIEKYKRKNKPQRAKNIQEDIYHVYLDYFKPVYLIFDQFEEIFIFGTTSEIEKFIDFLNNLLTATLSFKIIIICREEYLASFSIIEKELPAIFDNRIRIEKMSVLQLLNVIEKPCQYCNIKLEKGLSELIIEQLSENTKQIELTYLQVMMDKLYNIAIEENPSDPIMQIDFLKRIGPISDILGEYLNEVILNFKGNSELVENLLKRFVSSNGTRKQVKVEDLLLLVN